MNKSLILLRGVSGSGKTTLATHLCDAIDATSSATSPADDFRVDENGNYHFDASKLKDDHERCQDQTGRLMSLGIETSIVHNTFTKEWEMEAYFQMAKEFGYRVYSLIVENRHGGDNVHGVPDDKVEQQSDRFQIKLTK